LKKSLFLLATILTASLASANNTPHDLSTGPLTQNWSNAGLITTTDDWSGVPSIEGFQGGGLTGSNDVDPQTVLAADDPGTLDVLANQSSTSISSGGVAEFDTITDPVVAFQGSGSADAPYLQIYLNTTGRQDIRVQYLLRDIDGSGDDAAQQVGLHYRVGNSGSWTNLPGGYVADASTANLATDEFPIDVTLPAAAENQAQVQLRIMTTNASGSDEFIGVDDIQISSNSLTPPLTATIISSSNVSVNGGNDGSATAGASGGATPYNFQWSNGATTATISGLITGVYTVTVVDNLTAMDTASVTITEPTVVMASAVVDNNVTVNGGNDGQATASGSGGVGSYTYAWSDGQTTATATNLFASVYSVTVTDGNGANDVAMVTITEPTAVTASAVVDNNVTVNGGNDGQATASGSGGVGSYTYAWSDGQTTATATNLFASVYSVTVTDGNGGNDVAMVTITEPTAVTASAVVDNNVTVNGGNDGQATASGSGGVGSYTYAWSDGQTTATATNLSASVYSVTVTDSNGGNDVAMVTITEPTAVTASAVVDNNVSINGGSDGQATASGSGGVGSYTYLWSNGQTTATATNLMASTYNVTVTDANGGNDVASVTITEPDVLLATITTVTDESLPGAADGSATVTASGGTPPYGYLWSNGGTTATITGLTAGTYTVTVTDDNGATASPATAVVGVAGSLPPTAVPNNATWALVLLSVMIMLLGIRRRFN